MASSKLRGSLQVIGYGRGSMSIYYFNVDDGLSNPDIEGSDLPDLDTARMEAVRRSGALLQDHAREFWRNRGWKLIVTDAVGMVMFTLHIVAVASPATERYGQGADIVLK
jgi:hypothetical protein